MTEKGTYFADIENCYFAGMITIPTQRTSYKDAGVGAAVGFVDPSAENSIKDVYYDSVTAPKDLKTVGAGNKEAYEVIGKTTSELQSQDFAFQMNENGYVFQRPKDKETNGGYFVLNPEEESIKAISDCTIKLDTAEVPYTAGNSSRPAVTLIDGDYKLREGTDYDLTYSFKDQEGNSDVVMIGTALATGARMYSGSTAHDFRVMVSDGTANVSIANWVYGQKPQNPVAVSDTNGTDHVAYTYKARNAGDETYSPNVPQNAGQYTLRAVFPAVKGYREVTETADFEIKKAEPELLVAQEPDASGNSMKLSVKKPEGTEAEFSSDHPEVATVNKEGVVTYTGVGTANITVKLKESANYSERSVTTTIQLLRIGGRLVLAGMTKEVVYGTDDFSVDVFGSGQMGNAKYTSDNLQVAEVDQNGKVHITGVGETVITVSVSGGETEEKTSYTMTLHVVKADGKAAVEIEDWTYGEEAKAPSASSETNAGADVTYAYKKQEADDDAYTATPPSDTGTYVVKAIPKIAVSMYVRETKDGDSIRLQVHSTGGSKASFRVANDGDLAVDEEGNLTLKRVCWLSRVNISLEESENYAARTTYVSVSTKEEDGKCYVYELTPHVQRDDPGFQVGFTDDSGNNGTTYTSSNGGKWVTVDKNGNVSFSTYTTALITATKPGNEKYKDRSIVFNISVETMKLGTGYVEINGWTYGESTNMPIAASSTNGSKGIEFRYRNLKDVDVEANYSTEVPKNAGDYIVQAIFPQYGYYTKTVATAKFTIEKAKGWIKVDDVPDKTFGDPDFMLESSTAEDAKLTFASQSRSVVTVTPQGKVEIKGAGEAKILVKMFINQNYITPEAVTVTFKVNKAQQPPDMPAKQMEAPLDGKTLEDVMLPAGWSWENKDTKLVVGGSVTAKAVYQDKKNYEIFEVSISVTQKQESSSTPAPSIEPTESSAPSTEPTESPAPSTEPTESPSPAPQMFYGDMNVDGIITTDDALDILKYIVKLKTYEDNAVQMKLMDADHDGKATSNDALTVLKIVVKLAEKERFLLK